MINIFSLEKSKPLAKNVSFFKLVFVFVLCFEFISGVVLLSFKQETVWIGQGGQKDEEDKVYEFG